MERGNYKTFLRKAVYLYGDSARNDLQRFLVQTYCTINMNDDHKAKWQEDSLISFEPYDGKVAPPGYERGVRVLGTLPIIPVGDTRVGYDTVTKKIVFLGDVVRLKMASKLKRVDRYCRVYVIDSCNAQRASTSFDLGIEEMGFGEEWEVVKREARNGIEYLPNTTVTGKGEVKRRTIRAQKDLDGNTVSAVVPDRSELREREVVKDHDEIAPTPRVPLRVEQWVDASTSERGDAHSVTSVRSASEMKKNSNARAEKSVSSILRLLNQCMLSLDENTLLRVSSRVCMDVEAEQYLLQRAKEQGYGKKAHEVSDLKGKQVIANPGTEIFVFQKKDGSYNYWR